MLRGAQHHEEMNFANTPGDLVKRFSALAWTPI